jgi:hypothetical protein
MNVGEQISATITQGQYAGKTLRLDVEEFQPIEPSNYCWTAGWNCGVEIAGETLWFYVDEAGVVYDDENDAVGICPEQERAYAELCARQENFMRDHIDSMRHA